MNVVAENSYNNKYSGYLWVTLIVVLIFSGIIFHIYLPNLGGAGLSLPLNIISKFSIALIIFSISITQLKETVIHYSIASKFISIGLIIFTLLCFFSASEYQYNAYLTAYWILGALLFYQLLMQINISEKMRRIILWGIVISCIIESILAMIQAFNLLPLAGLPYPPLSGQRPYGIFQQVNVFSSFICVGIASAFYLIIKTNKITWYPYGFIIISLILMSAVLPLSQSLTGYLSLFLVVTIFCVFIKHHRNYILYASIAVIFGLMIGYGIKFELSIADVSDQKLQTSHIRWVLWQHSLSLFGENFLWGTGVGSFESVFLARFGGDLYAIHEKVMSHPHNEILRWMVEGGLIGLIAILFVILGGFYLLRYSLKTKNTLYLVVALPIIVHMMTEFPLWLSTPHAVILILLLRCADTPYKKYNIAMPVAIFSKGFIAIAGILTMILLYFTLQGQQYLTYIEKTGQQSLLTMGEGNNNFNYYLIYDRYDFDLNIGYLLRYNETQDSRYLELFDIWAERYLRTYPDINVYLSWLLVAKKLGDQEKAIEIYNKINWLFTNDKKLKQLNL